MADATKPAQRVQMVDSGGLVTLAWDSYFRFIGTDKPAELQAAIDAANQSILGQAVLVAFHD